MLVKIQNKLPFSTRPIINFLKYRHFLYQNLKYDLTYKKSINYKNRKFNNNKQLAKISHKNAFIPGDKNRKLGIVFCFY